MNNNESDVLPSFTNKTLDFRCSHSASICSLQMKNSIVEKLQLIRPFRISTGVGAGEEWDKVLKFSFVT